MFNLILGIDCTQLCMNQVVKVPREQLLFMPPAKDLCIIQDDSDMYESFNAPLNLRDYVD